MGVHSQQQLLLVRLCYALRAAICTFGTAQQQFELSDSSTELFLHTHHYVVCCERVYCSFNSTSDTELRCA
jgi:hypothetical protein